MTDLILSGIFTLNQGHYILECIDNYILFGKQYANLSKNIQTIYEEYVYRMKRETSASPSDTNISISEIVNNLNKNYKIFDIHDRFILIMDSIRKILFKKMNPPKKLIRTSCAIEKKDFNTRSRHKKQTTPTVISETTNVNSVFSRI